MSSLTSQPADTCGVAYALLLIGGKWKPLILWRLADQTLRFGQLKRSLPAISERVLIAQLKELERDGLIERKAYRVLPPKVEYRLTLKARTLMPILKSLETWGDTQREETIPA